MSLDRESPLRPLRAVGVDVEALRSGAPTPARVVRIARAAETVLRRLLRDDPTAPIDLRLRALSADDLPSADLLAELRRRDRLPLELAAALHELHAVAERLAGGGEPEPRDGELALSVADGLERHVLSAPLEAPMEDPVLAPAEETLIPRADDETLVHPVPAAERGHIPWMWVAGVVALLALLALVLFLTLRGGGESDLERGEAAYRRGRTAAAVEAFRRHSEEHPRDALSRVYLARIYREAGQRDSAVAELRTGLEAAPDDARLHAELGFLLLDGGRANEAVLRFRKAVELDAESTRAWSGLVRALRLDGQHAAAERVLARAPAEVRAIMGRADSAGVVEDPAGSVP